MAADLTSLYSSPSPAILNVLPIRFTNGQAVAIPVPGRPQILGPGATLPAGSVLPAVMPTVSTAVQPTIPPARTITPDGRNPYSTVQPAASSSAAAVVAPAAPPAVVATPTGWLDEKTLTSSFTNGQVVGAAALLLGLVYLMKRR